MRLILYKRLWYCTSNFILFYWKFFKHWYNEWLYIVNQ